ncbi:MAG TPA: hypothetical protein VHJ58_07680 [Vicinamibacterales bacterium]|jgi:threonine/homoserine/homoserine lactone efflux protein|nr:hypothetical protein [Vicinamibacterales bacterium]
MEPIVSLVVLLGALSVGAMSPGPSFVLVARTAIASVLGILGLKLVASARKP